MIPKVNGIRKIFTFFTFYILHSLSSEWDGIKSSNGFVMCSNFPFILFWKHCTWLLEAKTWSQNYDYFNVICRHSHIQYTYYWIRQPTNKRNVEISFVFHYYFSVFVIFCILYNNITRFIFHKNKFFILLLTLWYPNDDNFAKCWHVKCKSTIHLDIVHNDM